MLVTNRSSPTSCSFASQRRGQQRPAVPVALAHAILDRDDRIAGRQIGQVLGELRRREAAVLGSPARTCRRGRTPSWQHRAPGTRHGPACSPPSRSPREWSARPPRSRAGRARSRPHPPPPCSCPGRSGSSSACGRSRRHSAAPREEGAPTGRIMNSWMSRLLLACAPPLMMFIIGTGMTGSRCAEQVLEQRQSGLARRRMRVGQRHGQQRIGAQAAFGLACRRVRSCGRRCRPDRAPPCRSAPRAAPC